MKKFSFLAALLFCAGALFTACDDNEDTPAPTGDEYGAFADAIAGSYTDGYALAGCMMFQNMYSGSDRFTLTASADKTKVSIAYTSDSWGSFAVSDMPVAKNGSTCKFSGSGKVSMGMGGGSPKEYDFTLTGAIASADDATLTISVPAVMGGLEIVWTAGEAAPALKIAGSYTGSLVARLFGSDQAPETGVALTLSAVQSGDAWGLDLKLASETWSTYELKGLEVKTQDGKHMFSGEGRISLAMGEGEPKEYDFSLAGECPAAEPFAPKVVVTLPIMGTTTLTFTADTEAE